MRAPGSGRSRAAEERPHSRDLVAVTTPEDPQEHEECADSEQP